MSILQSRARAFGGGALCGGNVVRVAFLDEAGIGDPKQEPWVTVSGVIVDADKEWGVVETHLINLANECAPPDRRADFVFHAKELLNGGKVFPREKYNGQHRLSILKKLASIPSQFNLPVLFGFIERATFLGGPSQSGLSPTDHTVGCIVAAFIQCVVELEKFMREDAAPDEAAMIVMEDTAIARRMIEETHRALRDPAHLLHLSEDDRSLLQVRRIKELPHFAKKSDSSLLQISDTCAVITKRYLNGSSGAVDLYRMIADRLLARPKSDFVAGPSV